MLQCHPRSYMRVQIDLRILRVAQRATMANREDVGDDIFEYQRKIAALAHQLDSLSTRTTSHVSFAHNPGDSLVYESPRRDGQSLQPIRDSGSASSSRCRAHVTRNTDAG